MTSQTKMKINQLSGPLEIQKRISFKNNFEDCYLRHLYLKRITHNPSREEMVPYKKIVDNFANSTFYAYKNLFLLVGLDLEDVVNITQTHLVSFLGLFALERNPKKMAEFKKLFKKRNSLVCSKEDLLNKNKANFTCFLKQRLEDVVRVCRQKAKNIKGVSAEDFQVFRGAKEPPKDIEDLLENHSKYDYHPLGTSAFKTIRKRMRNKQEGPVYLDNDTWYVCVPIRKKSLNLNDLTTNNYSPYDNIHNMNPEQILENNQQVNWEDRWAEFNSTPDEEKTKVIESFVRQNKGNSELKQELAFATKLLGSMNGKR